MELSDGPFNLVSTSTCFVFACLSFWTVFKFSAFPERKREVQKTENRKLKTEDWRLPAVTTQSGNRLQDSRFWTSLAGWAYLLSTFYVQVQRIHSHTVHTNLQSVRSPLYIIYYIPPHTLTLYLSTFNVLWSVHSASRGIPQTEFQNFRVSHWYFPEMCPAWPSRLQFPRIRPSASPFLNADKILGTKYLRF